MNFIFAFVIGISKASTPIIEVRDVEVIYNENGNELVSRYGLRQNDFNNKILLRSNFANDISLSVRNMKQVEPQSFDLRIKHWSLGQ